MLDCSVSCTSGGFCGLSGSYDAFSLQLAADHGRNATRSALLQDVLCNGGDSVDLVQMSRDKCRHRERLMDDWDTSMAV